MNELENLRKQIDEIDAELLPLFLKRMDCSAAIAKYKKANNLPVLDRVREKEILDNKTALADKDKSTAVRDFFSAIMSISSASQKKILSPDAADVDLCKIFDRGELKSDPTVAYQGIAGANSETALIKIFGNSCKSVNTMTFAEVLDAVEKGDADYGILPLENSSTGSISDVYDLLESREFYIVGEVDIPIEHCLVGLQSSDIRDVRTVYSHEQGYLQCKDFFKNYPKIEFQAYYNTALAAKLIAGSGDNSKAAIADKRTAEIYGLKILAENISSNDNNITRFAAIAKRGVLNEKCNKISILFSLPNESGSLNHILSEFADNGLNLVKIESRPIHDKNFEYMFFVDFEGNLLDEKVRKIINTIAKNTSYLKLLGNYFAPEK